MIQNDKEFLYTLSGKINLQFWQLFPKTICLNQHMLNSCNS